MLPRFCLMIVCLTMMFTAGLVASSSNTAPAIHQAEQSGPQETVWIDHKFGVFLAEVAEFRTLKETDRADSTSDEPVYYVELRLVDRDKYPNPVQNPSQVIRLAVGQDMGFLEKNQHKTVRLFFKTDRGKLTALYSLSC